MNTNSSVSTTSRRGGALCALGLVFFASGDIWDTPATAAPPVYRLPTAGPTILTLRGSWPGHTRSRAGTVAVNGQYAYVGVEGAGLQIIDVSNPAAPVLVGGGNTRGDAENVSVVGHYAYVADGGAGLQIIDVSNPAAPVLVGGRDTPGYAEGVSVAGHYAYVADGGAGLQIIDVSNPAAVPLVVGGYDTLGWARDVTVVGRNAYVATEWEGLQIIDVSNPAAPVLAGSRDTSGLAEGVSVADGYAYVAVGYHGFQIIDVSNPVAPVKVANFDTRGEALAVSVAGKYAYVADGLGGLSVFEITSGEAPGQTASGDFNGDGWSDLVFGDGQGFLAVWFMNRTNMITPSFLNPNGTADTNWMVFGSGIFNSDAKSDIAFQHSDGTLATWFMDGINMTSAAYFNPRHPGGRNWRASATGDLNGDGKTDLVFQHTGGTLLVWFLDGVNLLSASLMNPSHPGDLGWRLVGTGDFDHDGRIDLVFQHSDGRLGVWLMRGTQLIRAASLEPPTTGDAEWRVASTGDWNLDGKPDLLFQHSNLDLAVWFMDGIRMVSVEWLNPRNPGGSWKVAAPK